MSAGLDRTSKPRIIMNLLGNSLLQLPSRLALAGASLLLLAAVPSVGGVEVLTNGTLDATSPTTQINPGPTGWVIEASKTDSGEFNDGADSEPWCNVADEGGSGVFFKPFQGKVDTGDLLSVFLYQDNPATPGTKYTLSGYAAAEINYSGLQSTNQPAPQTLFIVEFLDGGGSVIASNSLDLIAVGLPTGGPTSMTGFTMPEVTAPPNAATVRAGAGIFNVYSTSGQQSFFVDAFSLDAGVSATAPAIDVHPVDVNVAPGGTASFTVHLVDATGVTYQWQHARTNLVNGGNISGATTSTLTVANASDADVGAYRVVVTNNGGATSSNEASLATLGVSLSPVILLAGKVGDTYRIDYATSLAPTTWIPLSTNKLTSTPQPFVDLKWLQSQARFYQVVRVP